MTEEPPKAPAPAWVRSPTFKHFATNYFRYRIGLGEITIVMSRHGDSPAGTTLTPIIEEEVSVLMSWSHMKVLAQFLSRAVEEVEAAAGPIPMQVGVTPYSMSFGIKQQLDNLNLSRE